MADSGLVVWVGGASVVVMVSDLRDAGRVVVHVGRGVVHHAPKHHPAVVLGVVAVHLGERDHGRRTHGLGGGAELRGGQRGTTVRARSAGSRAQTALTWIQCIMEKPGFLWTGGGSGVRAGRPCNPNWTGCI